MAAPSGKDPQVVALADVLEKHLPEPVKLVLFTAKDAPLAKDQQRLLEEIVKLSKRLSLEVHDLDADREAAARHGVTRAPCTVVVGRRDHGLRFSGVTGGYEAGSMIEAILMAGNDRSGLDPTVESWVRRIEQPTRIEVFVTLTCPYCPRIVHVALQMAVANERVSAEMVESAEFAEQARAFGHRGVPFVVVNGRPAFEGTLGSEEAVLEIMRVAAPAAYEELEAELRAHAGARRVKAPQPRHRYDTIVVGAGPAAMSAAIYAVRKGLDVLLVGDRLGGQVADTATVENWLGVHRVGGRDLALMFRAHVEHYALAEQFHARVAAVERADGGFVVRLEDGTEYRGRSVVYAAGKQYRTLGVPGEDRFLGRGIAFCATCDAPLFQGRRVLVVGGGNSAFTAARDLLPYAAQIRLVNVLPQWQADAALQRAVLGDPKVVVHPATRVTEFIGEHELTGVRLEPAGGGPTEQVPIDGAFLEIGLSPNSGPVASLVPLNPAGEIVVNRDQSTSVPGFFAAGDVTDEPQKQIVVAEAAGAKAGLAAYDYVMSSGDGGRGRPPAPAS